MKSILIRLIVVGAVGLFTTSLIGCSESDEDRINRGIDDAADRTKDEAKDAEKKLGDLTK